MGEIPLVLLDKTGTPQLLPTGRITGPYGCRHVDLYPKALAVTIPPASKRPNHGRAPGLLPYPTEAVVDAVAGIPD